MVALCHRRVKQFRSRETRRSRTFYGALGIQIISTWNTQIMVSGTSRQAKSWRLWRKGMTRFLLTLCTNGMFLTLWKRSRLIVRTFTKTYSRGPAIVWITVLYTNHEWNIADQTFAETTTHILLHAPDISVTAGELGLATRLQPGVHPDVVTAACVSEMGTEFLAVSFWTS